VSLIRDGTDTYAAQSLLDALYVDDSTHVILAADEQGSGGAGGSSSSSSDISTSPNEMLSVPRSPTSPWKPLALPLFFNLFTAGEGMYQYQGFMPYLPTLYNQSGPTSCLHLSISAAAEANAVRKLTGDDALMAARRKYAFALAAVQRALEDPVEGVQDATLTSLFILTLFEVGGWMLWLL
jgi:hypothetical protein